MISLTTFILAWILCGWITFSTLAIIAMVERTSIDLGDLFFMSLMLILGPIGLATCLAAIIGTVIEIEGPNLRKVIINFDRRKQ